MTCSRRNKHGVAHIPRFLWGDKQPLIRALRPPGGVFEGQGQLATPAGFPGYKSLSGAGGAAAAGHPVLRQYSRSVAKSLCRSPSSPETASP